MSFGFDIFPDEEHALFPVLVLPLPDELFSSWIVRLAHANKIKVHTFTKYFFKTTTFWSREVDRYTPHIYFEILSKKTNLSVEKIQSLTLKSFEGRLFEHNDDYKSQNWILPLGVYHRTWKNNALMFCPGCLINNMETPYYKKQWRLSHYISCPDCGIMLYDCCPSCKRPVMFFRSELGKKSKEPQSNISICYNCDFDFKNSAQVNASAEIINMQLGLVNILRYGRSDKIIFPHQYFNVLHYWVSIFLSKRKQVKNLQLIVYNELGLVYSEPKGGFNRRFEFLKIEERQNPLIAAYWLLEEWPTRFIKIISLSNISSSDLLRDLKDSPFWYYSIIKEYFYISNANRNFSSFIKN